MYIGFFNYYEIYNRNKMFTDQTSPIGDNLMYPFVYLGQHLVKNGHKVSTVDMDDIRNFDAIVFIEFPTFKNEYFRQLIGSKFENLYLLILESLIIRPDNFDRQNHRYFKKIFTWDDDLVDGKKYLKINYAHKIPTRLDWDLRKKEKLCAMVIAHKFKKHPLELYTERVKAIRWFEENHPEDFDLYGIGWDEYCFKGILSRLNRFDFLRKFLRPKYSSYKGSVKSKRETYEKYKFAICYENARDIAGYITEKIFDCFFAGCVPVYWGAPNVTDHIPADTFIDKRHFETYEDLYSYLKNMSEKEYFNYLNAIKNFLQSHKVRPFSAEYFVDTLVNEIIKDFNR